MLKFEKKILDNGLRVILAPMDNTESVTMLVLVGVGSRYEAKNINGVSHFLEHMFFKASDKRPVQGVIYKELDAIGAAYNAFTDEESTGFWVKTASRNFDAGLDIFSDVILNPIFKEDDFEKEKGVISQEINMYEDEPQQKIYHDLKYLLYGEQPLGRNTLGTKETVGALKSKDLEKYWGDNYLAENTVLVIAGNIDKKKVFQKINKIFGKLKKGKNKKCQAVKIDQKQPRVKIQKKDTEQTHLAIALHAYDFYDERKHVVDLLSTILGGNMSSRLFTEIREKQGLAYYVYSTAMRNMDCGILAMGAGIEHDKMEMVVKKTLEILGQLKKDGVSERELKDAKGYYIGHFALKFETSDEVASYLASRELFYDKIIQPAETLKKIEKVSHNDILRVAKDILVAKKINMAVIGKHEGAERKEEFYKKMFGESI